MKKATPILGLKENARQFWLLVLINGFVGAMVGMERSVIPQFAETVFGISGCTVLLKKLWHNPLPYKKNLPALFKKLFFRHPAQSSHGLIYPNYH